MKIFLPLILCLVISGQTTFSQTSYCEDESIDLRPITGDNGLGITTPPGPGVPDHTIASNMTGTTTTQSKSISLYTFVPNATFTFTDPQTTMTLAWTLEVVGVYQPGGAGGGWAYHTVSTTNKTTTIIIKKKYSTTLNLPFTSICKSDAPVTLTGGSPSGGSYTGTEITGSVFDPGMLAAGAASAIIYYSVGSCSNIASQTISIKASPVITMTALNSVCVNASPVTLSCGSPSGGTYSGSGVTNGQFNPIQTGIGTNTIQYTYTSPATGCTGNSSTTISVLALPVVTFGVLSAVCKDSKPVLLTGGTPAGGFYSGPGVSSNNSTFDPTVLTTTGDKTITYNYTDNAGNKCSNSAISTIKILDAVKPAWPLLDAKSTMCKGNNQTLTLNNVGSYRIEWRSGNSIVGTTSSYAIDNISQDIPLTVNYFDANNCKSDDRTLTIVVDKIKADFSASKTSIKLGASVAFTDLSINASSWLWTMGTEGFSALQNPVFYFNKLGTKTIKLVAISSNNCKDSITNVGFINVTVTGVKDLNVPGVEQVKAYPNPFKDVLYVDLTGWNTDVAVNIVNMSGLKVIEEHFQKANGMEVINTSLLPDGTYLVTFKVGGYSSTIKLQKD